MTLETRIDDDWKAAMKAGEKARKEALSLLRAAIKVDEDDDEAAAAVAALKYYVGTAGRKLGEEAVQLHGGMGVTNELDVAHLFKRLTVIDTLFGTSDFQLSRYTDIV